MRRVEGPVYLYRAYGADDQLLYVGIAVNWARRWAQHSERSPWFAEVTRLALEVHPSQEAALSAEREACRTESPVYNIEHTDRDQRPAQWRKQQGDVIRHFVRSFDHRSFAGDEVFQRLVCAIDDAANRFGAHSDDPITEHDFERMLLDVARTVAYSDSCRICVDAGDPYTPWAPITGAVDGERIRTLHRCAEGHVWPCSWSVDAPEYW